MWVSHGLLYCLACCWYLSFLWGYLINDKFVCLVIEKYLLSWGLRSKCSNSSWLFGLVMGEWCWMLLRRGRDSSSLSVLVLGCLVWGWRWFWLSGFLLAYVKRKLIWLTYARFKRVWHVVDFVSYTIFTNIRRMFLK